MSRLKNPPMLVSDSHKWRRVLRFDADAVRPEADGREHVLDGPCRRDRRGRSCGPAEPRSTTCRPAPECRARRCLAPEGRDFRRPLRRVPRPDHRPCPARCFDPLRRSASPAASPASPRGHCFSARRRSLGANLLPVSIRARRNVGRPPIDDACARREVLLHRLAGLRIGANDFAAVGRSDPDVLAVVTRGRSGRCLRVRVRGSACRRSSTDTPCSVPVCLCGCRRYQSSRCPRR